MINISRKISIFGMFIAGATLSLSVASEVKMKHEHREALIYGVTQNVSNEFISSDPMLDGCWRSAIKGNDVSLLSMYVIARSTPIIVKYRDAMDKAVKSGGSNQDKYNYLFEAYSSFDPDKASWYLQRTPAAVLHCMEVSSGVDLSVEKKYLSDSIRERLDL